MKKTKISSDRQRLDAEIVLARAPLPELQKSQALSENEILHELRVHQIELEMQNEELQRIQASLEESHDRYVDLYDFAPVGYLTLTAEGVITEANLTAAALLGVQRQKLLRSRFARFIAADDGDRWHRHFVEVLRHDQQRQCELELQRHDGSRLDVQLDCMRMEADARPAMRVVLTDIRVRKLTNAKLHLIAKVFEQSGEAIMITDADRTIIMVNRAFTAISGYDEAHAIGQNQSMIQSDQHDQDFYHNVWTSIDARGHWQGEMWCRHKDGRLYLGWLQISRVLDADGCLTNYIGIFSDITEHKEAQEYIRRLAQFDPLTELPNRALLKDRIHRDLVMAKRNQWPLTLIFLDLDHFKNVNDSLGHQIGDQLLVSMASRLALAIRGQDTISRVGGDEFVLVLPNTGVAGAIQFAEKLLDLSTRPYQIEQHELVVTPSLGIAMYPDDGTDFETLSRCADVAMYRVKQAGRNGYRFFTTDMQADSVRILQLENALRHAQERNQFQLHYQPQVRLSDGRMIGVEALLRWEHPELGSMAPSDFIPIAEESGQILQIGEWVLRCAVRQCKAWIDSGLPSLTMAVNLSAIQFRDPRLPELVMRILEEEKLPPEYLELELTESVAMKHPVEVIAIMNKLRARGVRMSIDDFGTGYSSLSYLTQFKIYKLKIDQSFVRDIHESPENRAIITAIIGIAKSLGLQIIAEGVETEEQMTFLRENGCDEIQGFYISEPLSIDQFVRYVEK